MQRLAVVGLHLLVGLGGLVLRKDLASRCVAVDHADGPLEADTVLLAEGPQRTPALWYKYLFFSVLDKWTSNQRLAGSRGGLRLPVRHRRWFPLLPFRRRS